MQRQLYPAPCIEDSLEAHLARYPSGGHALYLAVVAAVVAAGGALPFVRVSVAVRSGGIIRPVLEKQEIRARVAGLVERVLVADDQTVRTGDTIAVFQSAAVDDRLALIAAQLAEKERLAADLTRLADVDPMPARRDGSRGLPAAHAIVDALQTADYRREYGQFANELRDNRLTLEHADEELARVRALSARHFASPSELRSAELDVERARAQGALIVERYRGRWQSALTSLRADMAQLASQQEQAREERALYTVAAPLAGTLEQVASLSPGSFVQAGEQLAVVSPSTELVADVYVAPRDIGLVRVGMPVRMLVDAFDYTRWGVVTGSVRAISSDFVQIDGHPMFRVTCALDARRVALPTGVVGELRKGMTLQAHFLVAQRSLLQLLSDDVTDWLDPSRASPSTTTAGDGSAP